VHLSTDVVFGGRPLPYTEADTPDPITDYGRWKTEAEAQVTAAHPGAILVRTSLIYGTEHLAPVQRDVEARDPYGRLLGYVYRSSDRLFVNEDLIVNGYARPLSIAPNTAFTAQFADQSQLEVY
jgi:hypothetical protein